MKDKKGESEQEKSNRNAVPILAPGIGTRIKAASERLGSRRSAAKAAGVSDDMLYRYIREQALPAFAAMAGLAKKAGVSLEWLAFDEGPMEPAGQLVQEEAPKYPEAAEYGRKDPMERYREAEKTWREARQAVGWTPPLLAGEGIRNLIHMHGLSLDGAIHMLDMLRRQQLLDQEEDRQGKKGDLNDG